MPIDGALFNSVAFTANFYLQSVQGDFFLFAVCSHAVIIYFGGLGLALYWMMSGLGLLRVSNLYSRVRVSLGL